MALTFKTVVKVNNNNDHKKGDRQTIDTLVKASN